MSRGSVNLSDEAQEAADALAWKAIPCPDYVLCCGSEADCQAVALSTKAVREAWLRAQTEEVLGND